MGGRGHAISIDLEGYRPCPCVAYFREIGGGGGVKILAPMNIELFEPLWQAVGSVNALQGSETDAFDDAGGLLVLRTALEALDRMRDAQAQILEDGAMVTDDGA